MFNDITEEAITNVFPIHIEEETSEEIATLLRAGETLPLFTTNALLQDLKENEL